MTTLTYNRMKIEMTDGKTYNLSKSLFRKISMKENHILCFAKTSGTEYIVNPINNFAYKAY
jgi:hypothetical protein